MVPGLKKMKDHSRKRHIAKAITWRIVGTLDTILLSWIISGDAWIGLQIGFAEVITKMVLYYFHERIWFRVHIVNSNRRHLLKTITWRILGTLDTMLLAWIITGDPITGLKIGLAEVLTKMGLYFLHEKVWYRTNFGLETRNKGTK